MSWLSLQRLNTLTGKNGMFDRSIGSYWIVLSGSSVVEVITVDSSWCLTDLG